LSHKSTTQSGSQRGCTRKNHVLKPPPIAKSISDNKKRGKKRDEKQRSYQEEKKRGMKNKEHIQKRKG
jgi:hypothetical protein